MVTFEPGGEPLAIGDYAFGDNLSLRSICLPARLHQINGLAMARPGLERIVVETGNHFFKVFWERTSCDDFESY
jgi:hypothetical protein